MSETGVGSRERASRGRRSAVGYGSVILCSAVLGAAGVLPLVMALYAVDQLVLAPLGLTRTDPTNNDGAAPVVIVGVLVPAVVFAIWAFLTAVLIRRLGLLGAWSWPLAAAALATPTVVFVATRIG